MNRRESLIGNGLLFIAALIWGCAFVAQSLGMDYMGPFTFQVARSLLGAGVLLPVILLRRGALRRRGELRPATAEGKKALLRGGIACGLLLSVATNLQQVALQHTTAGKAGFLTALYILMVPLVGVLRGRRPRPLLWLCIALAALGLYLLSVREGFVIARADLLLILCAAVFTGHILLVDHFSPKVSGLQLSALQFLVSGLISAIPMLLFEQPRVSFILQGWVPVLYAGVLSSGVAYTLQIIGQRRTSPTMASLIMSLESVFALVAGVLVLGERPGGREILGSALMFLAILLAQWAQMPPRRRQPAPEEA
ncbi:MAG: DMT family transporter [Christensenellales bacterium]